jgi:hypothetical protein
MKSQIFVKLQVKFKNNLTRPLSAVKKSIRCGGGMPFKVTLYFNFTSIDSHPSV